VDLQYVIFIFKNTPPQKRNKILLMRKELFIFKLIFFDDGKNVFQQISNSPSPEKAKKKAGYKFLP